MKRIMIIGCCGAGKSTLAQKLHRLTNIAVIHLDQYYWKPNWEESEKTAWEATVTALSKKKEWIMDGNYGGTMDIRLKKADTIIFLDYSTIHCLIRITKRTLKYHGTERPDMPQGCKERFDWNFFHYVARFNVTKRKAILDKLEQYKQEKKIFTLKNDREVGLFLNQLSAKTKIDQTKT